MTRRGGRGVETPCSWVAQRYEELERRRLLLVDGRTEEEASEVSVEELEEVVLSQAPRGIADRFRDGLWTLICCSSAARGQQVEHADGRLTGHSATSRTATTTGSSCCATRARCSCNCASPGAARHHPPFSSIRRCRSPATNAGFRTLGDARGWEAF